MKGLLEDLGYDVVVKEELTAEVRATATSYTGNTKSFNHR
jgi:hypothetical protein